MHIAHLQRHRAAPGARLINHARASEREMLDFAGKIIFWKNKEFVQQFRRNFLGDDVYLRIE